MVTIEVSHWLPSIPQPEDAGQTLTIGAPIVVINALPNVLGESSVAVRACLGDKAIHVVHCALLR
jgi:hypothetical protein